MVARSITTVPQEKDLQHFSISASSWYKDCLSPVRSASLKAFYWRGSTLGLRLEVVRPCYFSGETRCPSIFVVATVYLLLPLHA